MELFTHRPRLGRRLAGASLCALATLAVGVISSLLMGDSITTWYAGLDKPAWNPPNWLFGPAWSLLYILMGVAAYLVWEQKKDSARRAALVVYVVQLVLNAAWSIIFFTFRQPALAFGEIVILWIAIVATIVLFWRIRPLAGALLLPYVAWVSFALSLNLAIWLLN